MAEGWQTTKGNFYIPKMGASSDVSMDVRYTVKRELNESEAWLFSIVLPMTAQLLELGDRFGSASVLDGGNKQVAQFQLKGFETEALRVAHMIDRFARYAAYTMSEEGTSEFDSKKDYERHIALPEENERLLVTLVIGDALRRNKAQLLGE